MEDNCSPKYGNCIFADVKDYVCVDLETTGLSSYNDAIIEIGAAKVADNVVVDSFQTLVNPGFRIPPYITGLTGITTEMVIDAPQIEDALSSFLDFAGDSILVGHNIHSFDIKFLRTNAERALNRILSNDYFDTLRLARRLYPEAPHNRLADLIVRLDIADREEHRALSDALQTVDVFNAMKQVMEDRNITFDCIRPKRESCTDRGEYSRFGYRGVY